MRVIDWSDNQVGAIMLAERKHWSHFRSVIPENWEEIHDEVLLGHIEMLLSL